MIDSPISLLRSIVPALRGVRILDVGSGDGGLASLLVAEGAEVVGIDPNPRAIVGARINAPSSRFDLGSAEDLPYADASFDVVIFVNALHHVPIGKMEAALEEASRVLQPDGFLIVIEPLPSGSAFEALRIVEDETVVRLAAQDALNRAKLNGRFAPVDTVSYLRRDTYGSAERVLDNMLAVDPKRGPAIHSRRADVIAAIQETAERSSKGELILEQEIKADIMRKSEG